MQEEKNVEHRSDLNRPKSPALYQLKKTKLWKMLFAQISTLIISG